MRDIVIIGAGGLGREVQWLIERINNINPTWNMLGYLDDNIEKGTIVNGYTVIGGIDWLKRREEKVSIVCAIGSANLRKEVISRIKNTNNIEMPNIIDPNVVISPFVDMGVGNIICASTVLTVNIKIGDFCIINLDCTIGHDDILESYITIYPSVNVSGNVNIGECSEIGTGTSIIQGVSIASNTILGAGSTVVKNISASGLYVGTPAKLIKSF